MSERATSAERDPSTGSGPEEWDAPLPPSPLSEFRRPLTVLAAALALVLTGLLLLGLRDSIGAGPDLPPSAAPTSVPMLDVAPPGTLHRDAVPEALAVHYRAAEAHPETFAAVPCFCGCEAALGHRHLLDCFLLPNGTGWEAHASGCGVCLGEAAQVEELLGRGTATSEIRAAVVAEWGDPYATS